MGKTETKFDEEKILAYKENGDELIFNQIINDPQLKNYIRKTCWQKLRHVPTTMYSLEDFTSISYLIVWQCIHKYRFICPNCSLQAKSHVAYKMHMVTKHCEYLEPVASITRYIKFNLGVYLQNTVRAEYSHERKTNTLTINIFSPDEGVDEGEAEVRNDRLQHELASNDLIEDSVVFKDTIAGLVKQFDPLTKDIFTYLYEDKMKQRDIAAILYEQGKYSSEQSAAVVISRVVKNKINPAIAMLYPELNN